MLITQYQKNDNFNAEFAGKHADDAVDAVKVTRKQAFKEAKLRAGVSASQQPSRQWTVGNNKTRSSLKNYKYDSNPTSHGRYYEYDTPNGKRVIAEHTNDGQSHFHAGEPKGNSSSRTYDFKENRYQKINGQDGDHHIYYGN